MTWYIYFSFTNRLPWSNFNICIPMVYMLIRISQIKFWFAFLAINLYFSLCKFQFFNLHQIFVVKRKIQFWANISLNRTLIREKIQVIQGLKIAHTENCYIILTINITKEWKLKIENRVSNLWKSNLKSIAKRFSINLSRNEELSNVNLEFKKAFLIMWYTD